MPVGFHNSEHVDAIKHQAFRPRIQTKRSLQLLAGSWAEKVVLAGMPYVFFSYLLL